MQYYELLTGATIRDKMLWYARKRGFLL